MAEPIIKIENLGKAYEIGHQKTRGYVALRDVLIEQAENLMQGIRDPRKFFGNKTQTEEFWALKDINLEITRGDKVAIIGHNGAGKSSLLKILSQITEPTIGRITINGRVSSLLEVGTGFHPELTGRENVYLNGSILGMSHHEIRRKFDEIVEFAGVEKFLDTPVKRYSSGMRARLGFAVAAHLESEILVIDEVLAVGDAEFQKKCLGKMDDVSRSEGRTILFVSHNIGAIRQLCNRAVLLEKGVLYAQGSVDEITRMYTKRLQTTDGYVPRLRSPEIAGFEFPAKFDIESEDDLSFAFKITTSEDIKECVCDVMLYNEQQEKLVHIRNHETRNFFDLKAGENKISIRLEKPNLTMGDYYMTFHIAEKDRKKDHLILDGVNLFSVVGFDKGYGSSGIISPRHQIALCA